MKLHHTLPFLILTLTSLSGPGLAWGATADCASTHGTCEVSNDGNVDSTECMCTDGTVFGDGGSNKWGGLTEMDLQPICEDQLAAICGPFLPPEFLECYAELGYCAIDNDPEDSLQCECWDGSYPGFVGGNAWADWTDEQLLAECAVQAVAACPPPPVTFLCSNPNGECTIANEPADFVDCTCSDGSAGASYGGSAWAGYSELDLLDACGTQLVSICGGPFPTPPWVECSSSLGECTIGNLPADLLECTCADGTAISRGGGSTWARLSEEELFEECEVQLYEGCSADTSDSGGTSTEDTGSGSTSSSSASSTGEPGEDTGVDESGGAIEGSSGTPGPVTTGDDAPAGSEGGDGGAIEGGGGGCGCSTSERPHTGAWALMLFGLAGAFRRRRRPARAVASRRPAAAPYPSATSASIARRVCTRSICRRYGAS